MEKLANAESGYSDVELESALVKSYVGLPGQPTGVPATYPEIRIPPPFDLQDL